MSENGHQQRPKGEPEGDWRTRCILVAAALLQPGASVEEAARLVKVSTRTVRRWRNKAWWPAIQQDAARLFEFDRLNQAALRGLERALLTDGRLALDWLGRQGLVPTMRPEAGAGSPSGLQVFIATLGGGPAKRLRQEEPPEEVGWLPAPEVDDLDQDGAQEGDQDGQAGE